MTTSSIVEAKELSSEILDVGVDVDVDISINSDAGIEACLRPHGENLPHDCRSPHLQGRMAWLLSKSPCTIDADDNKENTSFRDSRFPQRSNIVRRHDSNMTNANNRETHLHWKTSPTNFKDNDDEDTSSIHSGFQDSPLDNKSDVIDSHGPSSRPRPSKGSFFPTVHDQQPKSPGIRSSFQAPYRPPTKLHELCAQAQTVVDLKQARAILLQIQLPRKEILNFTKIQDGKGRTPLHLLSENKDLSESLDDNASRANMDSDNNNNNNNNDGLFPDLVSKASYDDDHHLREMIVDNFVLDFVFNANPSAAMAMDNEGTSFWHCILDHCRILKCNFLLG